MKLVEQLFSINSTFIFHSKHGNIEMKSENVDDLSRDNRDEYFIEYCSKKYGAICGQFVFLIPFKNLHSQLLPILKMSKVWLN